MVVLRDTKEILGVGYTTGMGYEAWILDMRPGYWI